MPREDYNRGGLDYENRDRDYNRDYDMEDYNRGYEGRGIYGRETRGYNKGFDRDHDQNFINRERGFGRDFDEDRGYGFGRSQQGQYSGQQQGQYGGRQPGQYGGGYNEGNTGQNWSGRNYSQSGYGGENYRSFGQPYTGQGYQNYQGGSYGQHYPYGATGAYGQNMPMQHQQQHQGFYGQRNDDEVEREVYDRLDNDWQIPDNADIHAKVDDGVVTLTGQVRNRNAKMAAWNCVWQIPGVEDVHNNIQIQSRRRQNQMTSGQQHQIGSGQQMSTGTSMSQTGSKMNQQDTSKTK